MARVLAIDPGCDETAFVVYDGQPIGFGKVANEDLRRVLAGERISYGGLAVVGGMRRSAPVAIEMIASYGMPVGREVFETCVWIGRFIEAWGGTHDLVYRREVKLELCGNVRAKDGNVRQALIDRYGGKDAAIGKKATPGPLYGMSADVWAALGVAVTWAAKQQQAKAKAA